MIDERSDPRTELAILAACFWSKTARTEARRHLVGGDFYDPRHERLWNALHGLDKAGQPVDNVTMLAAIREDRHAVELLPQLITTIAEPDAIPAYANIVRGWSVKRKIETAARVIIQEASGATDATWPAKVVSRFTAIRDGGQVDDLQALTLAELLLQEDDTPEWLIPGLLERRDRLILTGEEGLGKSHLMRQLGIYAAAGLHPFDLSKRITPIKVAIIDNENSWTQVRRKARPMVEYAERLTGDSSTRDRVVVDCVGRMDITRDRDLSRIHQLLDSQFPDLVIIGPLYRLTPRALQTDDEASPVLAALDTIRERGCALLTEAHAGHAQGAGGVRDMRPRGSSALMGWPEFGYGLRGIGTEGYADLVPWRGNREERDWPTRLRRGDGFRWTPHI